VKADEPGAYERYLVNVICARQNCGATQVLWPYIQPIASAVRRSSSIPSDEPLGFFVTLERSPNAWALKHYVGVTVGLLNLRLSRDELAFVYAHELSHVELGHYQQKIDAVTKIYIVAAILMILSQGNYNPLNDPYFVAVARIGLAAFSRDQETQADLHGLQIMQSAGFDPRASISVLRKLDPLGLGGTGDLFADHPSTSQRIATLQTEIANLPRPVVVTPNSPPPESSSSPRGASGTIVAKVTQAVQRVGDIQFSIHLDDLTFSANEDVRVEWE